MLSSQVFFDEVAPALNAGLWMSIKLIIPSSVLGFLLGVLVGVVRVFAPAYVRSLANGYVALFRGVPLLLQLYFLYYGLPSLGIRLDAYIAAVLGFVLCSGAYHSEYIRGALLSIRQGQVKAAQALGFTTLQTVLFVVIPQAARRALPGCGNEIIYLVKYSSLAHLLTLYELTGQAKQEANIHFAYSEIFFLAGLYYLFLTTVATWLLHHIEKRTAIPGFGVH